MLIHISVLGVHEDINADIRRYATRKLLRLNTFVPRRMRLAARADVKLLTNHAKDKNTSTCEVILHLPEEVFIAKETTVNMFAAVDIVEARLRNQLKKHKEKTLVSRLGVRRFIYKLRTR